MTRILRANFMLKRERGINPDTDNLPYLRNYLLVKAPMQYLKYSEEFLRPSKSFTYSITRACVVARTFIP